VSTSLNIFVTGAGGFLGRHLCQALRAAGHRIVAPTSAQCDLRRRDSFAPWSGERFDRIYHLAAWTQAGDFCLQHPGEQWLRNQQLNTNILSWWAEEQRAAKLISIGTSCAYDPGLPLSEEHYLDGRPIESLFTYGMTKRMLWAGQDALCKQFGLRHLTLVPSTLYGPAYHADGRQLHFIFDLIRKIVSARRHNTTVELWGDGWQKRELIHMKDFVAAILYLSDHSENTLVNVGAGEEHAIRTFAQLICEHTGFDPAMITYDTTRYVGARSKCLRTARLRRLMPDFKPVHLSVGLPPVIDWVSEQLVFRSENSSPNPLTLTERPRAVQQRCDGIQ